MSIGARPARLAAAALCLLAAACGAARAQVETPDTDMVFARKGSGSPIAEGHGWFVARDSIGPSSRLTYRIVLEHLPPRFGDTGDLSGVVRRVFSMEVDGREQGTEGGVWTVSGGGVDGIAWKKNRVYLLMPEERLASLPGTGLGRRVMMVSTVHAAGSVYEYAPPGRATARAALPSPAGGSAVVGLAALPGSPPRDGVCALVVPTMGRTEGDLGRTELWVMSGERWAQTNAPWDLHERDGWTAPPRWRVRAGDGGRTELEPIDGGGVQLIEWRDGVALAIAERGGESLSVWIGTERRAEGDAGPVMDWRSERYSLLGAGFPGGRVPQPMRLAFVAGKSASGDVLVGWMHGERPKSERGLVALRPTGPVQIASLEGVPASADMIPMAAPGDGVNPAGRVAMVWGTRSAERADRRVVREYSAATGLQLYDGSARVDEFEDRRRMQFAGIVVALGTIGMLAVAFRSRIEAGVARATGGSTGIGVLPAGSVGRGSGRIRAAAPVRRLGAAVLDYAPSAVLVALVQGRDAVALLTPSTMFGGAAGLSADLDLGPFAMALGLTVLHTTILEWAFGRSIGKFILGVRVVDARRSGGESGNVFVRPMLWQTFVRNLVRWCAPLLAVFALLDEAGRHPGDLAGQTLVVADPNDGS